MLSLHRHAQAARPPSKKTAQRTACVRPHAMTVQTVLVINGKLREASSETPQTLLARNSSGAYTTALLRSGKHIVDWDLHLARLSRYSIRQQCSHRSSCNSGLNTWVHLCRNLQQLHKNRPPTFRPFMQWVKDTVSSSP